MKLVRKLLAAAALMTAASTTPVSADLHFSHIPMENGDSGILVVGNFEMSDDLSVFDKMVQQHQPVVVTFYSPGGSIFKALQLGRRIRHHGLQTFQAADSVCLSACAYAFMGGAGRFAEHRSIGLHRTAVLPGYYADTRNAVAAVQQATAEIMMYLVEMGVDPAILQLSLSTDNGDMYFMSTYEMTSFKVNKELGHRKAVH